MLSTYLLVSIITYIPIYRTEAGEPSSLICDVLRLKGRDEDLSVLVCGENPHWRIDSGPVWKQYSKAYNWPFPTSPYHRGQESSIPIAHNRMLMPTGQEANKESLDQGRESVISSFTITISLSKRRFKYKRSIFNIASLKFMILLLTYSQVQSVLLWPSCGR